MFVCERERRIPRLRSHWLDFFALLKKRAFRDKSFGRISFSNDSLNQRIRDGTSFREFIDLVALHLFVYIAETVA